MRVHQLSAILVALLGASVLAASAHAQTTFGFVVHRNGYPDASYASDGTVIISNAEAPLSFTLRSVSGLENATNGDVVTDAGNVVSGVDVRITGRHPGDPASLDFDVSGLAGNAPGKYRIRFHFVIQAGGDQINLRLVAVGKVNAIALEGCPPKFGGAYLPVGAACQMRVTGTQLQTAQFLGLQTPKVSFTRVSRSSTEHVYNVQFTGAVSVSIFSGHFVDEFLGLTPNEVSLGFPAGFTGNGELRANVATLPTAISVLPQPARAGNTLSLNGTNFREGGLALRIIEYRQRYSSTVGQFSTFASSGALTTTSTNATFTATADMASEPLTLRFVPTIGDVGFSSNSLPDVVLSMPFSFAAPPTIERVVASAEQSALSGVRVVRGGSLTVIGRYLFSESTTASKTSGTASTFGVGDATTVRLGTRILPVTVTKYVAPAGSIAGRDSVRVALPDLSDNVFGQVTLQTAIGSATDPSNFVLATAPRVTNLTELLSAPTREQVVSTLVLQRGHQYHINGAALSIVNGAQLLQTGVVRLGGAPVDLVPSADPNTQLRFLVPLKALSGDLTVSTAGGDTKVGTFTVTDPDKGSVPTPRPVGLIVSASSVATGINPNGTITLDNPGASVKDFAVALTSSDERIALVPPTLAMTGTSATFPIRSMPVNVARPVTITATSGGASQTVTLTVTPAVPISLSVDNIDVVPGATPTGTLTFTGTPVPTAVTVTTSDPIVTAPASFSVKNVVETFPITVAEVPAPRTVTITATGNGTSKSTNLTVTPLAFVTAATPVPEVRTGNTGPLPQLTFSLNRAPAVATVFNVASDDPSLLQLDQATVTVPAGQTTGSIGLRALKSVSAITAVRVTISRTVVTPTFGTLTITQARTVRVVP